MEWYEMVSEKTIAKWVKRVNKEIGREDRNEFCISWFMKLRSFAHFIDRKEWYMVYIIAPNMWGDLELHIVSCYVRPQYRVGKYFLQIQRKIKELAIKNKVRYTIQGSHIDNKYFKFLKGLGYEVSDMRKEF